MIDTPLTRRDFMRTAASFALAGWAGSASTLAAETPYQIGCYTRPWDQFDYRTALDGIAEAGFKYAGLMTAKGKWTILRWRPETSSRI